MPRASIAEFAQLVRMTLLDDATVVGLVGGRVYATRVEDADNPQGFLAEGPAIVFEEISGDSAASGFIQHVVFEVYGYSSRTRDESRRVFDAAYNALHECCLRQDGIDSAGVARELQRPVSAINQKIGAYYTRGRFQASLSS